MKIRYHFKALTIGMFLLMLTPAVAMSQFTAQWLDIGTFHSTYVESGAQDEVNSSAPDGMEWPAILRNSSHYRARALWLGTKNWTAPDGQNYPYFVARIGPRTSGADVTYPIQNRLISRTEDTVVEVDGALSFDNVAVIDEIDPSLPADRMIHNIHNTYIGVTVDRKAYAYVNQVHDDSNVIEYTYTNTGNTDEDEDIELPDQNLSETYFFRIHRLRGNLQGAWAVSGGQVWGKFSMIDVVGDGHADYPISFTSQYLWIGIDPETQDYDRFGASLFNQNFGSTSIQGDSIGRLAGATYIGRATIHADNSPTDPTYIRCTMATINTCQPSTMGFMDQDEALTSDGSSHEDYYEWGIRTRENPDRIEGGSAHMFPHYADRIEPDGMFWEPENDSSTGKQGGHAFTTAYGPYDFAPGESVRIVVVEGVGGLSIDAAVRIGRAFKLGGRDRDTKLIRYDANGDGTIQTGTFDFSINQMDVDGDGMFDTFGHGLEEMTKNQWVVTARDSLLAVEQRAINLYAASNNMTTYPVPEAPHSPTSFTVVGRPDKVEIAWTSPAGGPGRTAWKLYRTSRFEDYIYQNCFNLDTRQFIDGSNASDPSAAAASQARCGYDLIADLGPGATSYEDTDLNRGTDYYYYLQAVGEAQSVDPDGINGTPTGAPLRSSRYLTQTYLPVNLKRPPYGATGTVADARIVPNPVNLGSDPTIRFDQEDRVAFFNIPGNCTIKVYTEIGELVHTIEHNDGSGDELWNLTTTSRQLLVSGIYIAVISDNDTGDEAIQKFTVIR